MNPKLPILAHMGGQKPASSAETAETGKTSQK
jgi:hypothetical protein